MAIEAAPYVVIVDVLRFTTAVDVAVARGAKVKPQRWFRPDDTTWLSPTRLSDMTPAPGADPITIPSPNGSNCSSIARERGATVVAASLRNAGTVAAWLNETSKSVIVIACGERWPDGSLRPAVEDYLGAGAVIARLAGSRSPEAEVAGTSWVAARARAGDLVRAGASGLELTARGFTADLDLACAVDQSTSVPVAGAEGVFANVGA